MLPLLLSLFACSDPFFSPVDDPTRGAGAPPAEGEPPPVDPGEDTGDSGESTEEEPTDTADTADAGEPPPPPGDVVLYVAVDGDDAATGDPDAPLASMQGVHDRLVALAPTGSVDVRIAPGEYYCRGMAEDWTFNNGAPIRVGPDGDVASPAKENAEDPKRPVFYGRDASDENCDVSVWFTVRHVGVAIPMTIEGLAIMRYRGAITIAAEEGVTDDPDLGIAIRNVVFQRIGDKYHYREHTDGTWLEGKGAILLTRTSGCSIEDSWFDNIRNVEGSEGLVHAIYFTSRASRHRVEGNTFHGGTGAHVKLSDYSNENRFLDNHFSYAPHGVRDRWCGADEDPVEACEGGVPQCPSWDNYLPTERNTWGNLDAGDIATILAIPEGQVCDQPPPSSNVRIDLGDGGVVLGP